MTLKTFVTDSSTAIEDYLQISKEKYNLMIFDVLPFPDAASRNKFVENMAEEWAGTAFFDGKDGLRYHVMPPISENQISFIVTRRINPNLPDHIRLMITALAEGWEIPQERFDEYSKSDWELFRFCGERERLRNVIDTNEGVENQ